MENKPIMSASEWLLEHYPHGPIDGSEYRIAMERYANYKTRELESKILDFRTKMSLYTFLTIKEKYDEHFQIQVIR